MNRSQKFYNLIRTLHYITSRSIMIAGICIVAIFALISFDRWQGTIIDARPDFNNITSGWYAVLWITLIVIYAICKIIMFIRYLLHKKQSKAEGVNDNTDYA